MPNPHEEKLLAAIEKARAAGDTAAVNVLNNRLARGRAKEEVESEYGHLPFYQKPVQAGVDILRLAAEGALGSHLGEATGGLHSVVSGEDYGTSKALEEGRIAESYVRSGLPGILASGAGAVRSLGGIYNKVKGPISSTVKAIEDIPYVGSIGSKIADKASSVIASGTTGGIGGGIEAAGEDRNVPEGVAAGILAGKLAGPAGQYSPIATEIGIEAFDRLKKAAKSKKENK